MGKNVWRFLFLTLLMELMIFPDESSAKSKKKYQPALVKSAGYDVEDVLKVHNIGKLWSATSNYGI